MNRWDNMKNTLLAVIVLTTSIHAPASKKVIYSLYWSGLRKWLHIEEALILCNI